MPWPPEVATFIRIGRLADNDIVLDDPRVSGHHARLIVVAGCETLIEDIGSSNGTFLNSADHRVTRPTRSRGRIPSISERWRFRPLDCWPGESNPPRPRPFLLRPGNTRSCAPARRPPRGRAVGLVWREIAGSWLRSGPGAGPCGPDRFDFRPAGRRGHHRGEPGIGRAGDRLNELRLGGGGGLAGLLVRRGGNRSRQMARPPRRRRPGNILRLSRVAARRAHRDGVAAHSCWRSCTGRLV